MKKKKLIILIGIIVILSLSLIIFLNKKEENHYVIKNSSEYNSQYLKRGYYVEKTSEGKILVTIAQGMHSSGGYGISITKINFIDDEVQIEVKETYPKLYEIVTQAFTYPIAQVEFDKIPNHITIQSLNSFESFEKQSPTNNDD